MRITIRFLIESCVYDYNDEKSVDLCMETAIYLRNHPKVIYEALDLIIEILQGRDTKKVLSVLRLTDICFINSGYAFQKEVCSPRMIAVFTKWVPKISRGLIEKFLMVNNNFSVTSLNSIVGTGFESYNNQPLLQKCKNHGFDSFDIKLKIGWAILGMVSKWYNGHAKYLIKEQQRVTPLSIYYLNFLYLGKLYLDLTKKGYIFPEIERDEVRIILPFISKLFLSSEVWEEEVNNMLNYRLGELTVTPDTATMANQVIKDITRCEENNYWKYENYVRRCLNTVIYHLQCFKKQKALTLEHCTLLDSWRGSMNKLLSQEVISNDTLKNQLITKSHEIQELIENRGSKIGYIPTYKLDLVKDNCLFDLVDLRT